MFNEECNRKSLKATELIKDLKKLSDFQMALVLGFSKGLTVMKDGTEFSTDNSNKTPMYEVDHTVNCFKSQQMYTLLRDYFFSLGTDVSEKETQQHIAFKRNYNFVNVELKKNKIVLALILNTESYFFDEKFMRLKKTTPARRKDTVSVSIINEEDLAKVEPYIRIAYEQN